MLVLLLKLCPRLYSQDGCSVTAMAEAFAVAQLQGKGQTLANALESAGAGNVQSCLPASV
jgi:hypothetical protein